ncbi:hypothetical protein C8Q75DRAFT_295847 [Abortiporus biennis]|nr:hypothetical protein C8Q75DRAFT_295847 [Abortiporus biennis]
MESDSICVIYKCSFFLSFFLLSFLATYSSHHANNTHLVATYSRSTSVVELSLSLLSLCVSKFMPKRTHPCHIIYHPRKPFFFACIP